MTQEETADNVSWVESPVKEDEDEATLSKTNSFTATQGQSRCYVTYVYVYPLLTLRILIIRSGFSLKGSKKKKKTAKSNGSVNGPLSSIDNLIHLLEVDTTITATSQKTSQESSQSLVYSSIEDGSSKQFLGLYFCSHY